MIEKGFIQKTNNLTNPVLRPIALGHNYERYLDYDTLKELRRRLKREVKPQ